MNEVLKNQKLLSKLLGENCLLDTKLENLSIFDADGLKIEIIFRMRPKSNFDRLLIRFIDVFEYSFYYNSDYNFYNVERYKFFFDSNKKIYLSLDPFNEKDEKSEEDQDFILAKEVIGISLQRNEVSAKRSGLHLT